MHKWIRTGQVRVNGGRAKAWQVLEPGDAVRVPPFARPRTDMALPSSGHAFAPDLPFLGADLSIVAADADCLVLGKPAGLACQPGTGQTDSVADRLRRAFAGSAYLPAPAHRLDRRTSGLLLAARTHRAQQRLHALFASGGIVKEYLAWVAGLWPHSGPCLLEDLLRPACGADGREYMAALPGGRLLSLPRSLPLPMPLQMPLPLSEPRSGPRPQAATRIPADAGAARPGLSASCAVQLVQRLPAGGERAVPSALTAALDRAGGCSLLLVRLFSGRKHQIRVQLAARGFPVLGDWRYGGPEFSVLFLHAYALSLPAPGSAPNNAQANAPNGAQVNAPDGAPRSSSVHFSLPPPWPSPFAPDPALLAAAHQGLNAAIQCDPGLQNASPPQAPPN